jgi:hypothetical protein
MNKRFAKFALVGVVGVVLALAACSSDQLGVVVLSARAPGDKCDYSDDTLYVSGGSVDFRPYTTGAFGGVAQTTNFYQVFSWENNLQKTPLSVNGQVVDPGSGNDFIADSTVYSYRLSDGSATIPDQIENVRAVAAAGTDTTKSSVPANLIQPGAAAILDPVLGPAAKTLLVTFHYEGKTAAGASLHTNDVTFPVYVYKSGDGSVLNCFTGGFPNPDGGTPIPSTLQTGTCGIPGKNADIACIPAG